MPSHKGKSSTLRVRGEKRPKVRELRLPRGGFRSLPRNIALLTYAGHATPSRIAKAERIATMHFEMLDALQEEYNIHRNIALHDAMLRVATESALIYSLKNTVFKGYGYRLKRHLMELLNLDRVLKWQVERIRSERRLDADMNDWVKSQVRETTDDLLVDMELTFPDATRKELETTYHTWRLRTAHRYPSPMIRPAMRYPIPRAPEDERAMDEPTSEATEAP